MNKIGLVLEGGGMRGLFTAGVLDCFLDEGIDVDKVIGVSAGACHGCSFVSKQKGRAKATNLDYLKDKRYCSFYSWITTGDLFGAKFLYDTIPNELNKFDHEVFNKNSTELISVMTDVETGEAVYYPLKDMSKDIQALRASASLPLVSKMVEVNGRYYLDGGISDSVPLKKIQESCDKVIVILTQERGYRKKASKSVKLVEFLYRKYPRLVQRMKSRHIDYNETMDYLDKEEKVGNVFVVTPDQKVEIGRIEKDREKLETLYQQGYQVAKGKIEEIKKFMTI